MVILYFIDLNCADCPLCFWAHVFANGTNLFILLLGVSAVTHLSLYNTNLPLLLLVHFLPTDLSGA